MSNSHVLVKTNNFGVCCLPKNDIYIVMGVKDSFTCGGDQYKIDHDKWLILIAYLTELPLERVKSQYRANGEKPEGPDQGGKS